MAAKRSEEVFHAGRLFPEWDIEQRSPHLGLLRSPTFTPRGRHEEISLLLRRRWPRSGRKRCSTQDVSSPNGTSNNVPSSGFALLTHLPPKGKAWRSTVVKPSPSGEGAERREAEEVFHAGRIFPEWDIEQRPLIRVRCAHPPSPQGEGMGRSTAYGRSMVI